MEEAQRNATAEDELAVINVQNETLQKKIKLQNLKLQQMKKLQGSIKEVEARN